MEDESTSYIRDNMSLEYYMTAIKSLFEFICELQESNSDAIGSEDWEVLVKNFNSIIEASELAIDAVTHAQLLKSEGW